MTLCVNEQVCEKYGVCVCLGTCGTNSSLTLTFSWLCLQGFWWYVMWTSEACRSVYNRAGCDNDRDLTTAVRIHAFIPLTADLWLRLKGMRDSENSGLFLYCTSWEPDSDPPWLIEFLSEKMWLGLYDSFTVFSLYCGLLVYWSLVLAGTTILYLHHIVYGLFTLDRYCDLKAKVIVHSFFCRTKKKVLLFLFFIHTLKVNCLELNIYQNILHDNWLVDNLFTICVCCHCSKCLNSFPQMLKLNTMFWVAEST